jgi:CheY-like chemotaxis protein
MTQKLRVLLAEGASGKAASALRELFQEDQGRMELTEVSGVSTLIASLKLVSPEVILLELALGNPDILGTVRLIHRTRPEVPLIAIGDSTKEEIAVASLREGAMDYLLKNRLDPQTLDRVLRSALERNTLKGLADLLRDPTTGLYIRDGFLTLGSHIMLNIRGRPGAQPLAGCLPFPRAISPTCGGLPFARIAARRGNGVEAARRRLRDRSPASPPPFLSGRTRHDGIHHRRCHRAARDGATVAPGAEI